MCSSDLDVQPVYVYDEPVTLDKEGVEYDLILPSQYGVTYKGPVYFTTRNTLISTPHLVSRFLQATMKGWRQAANDPSSAIDALARIAPSVDKVRELEVLKRALPYYVSDGRAMFDSMPETWTPMLQDLRAYKILERDLSARDFLALDLARAIANSSAMTAP